MGGKQTFSAVRNGMGLKVYLPVAAIVFAAATTGAEVVAGTSIAGETFAGTLRDSLHWSAVEWPGTLVLLAPFVAVAIVCAFVEKRARTRSVLVIFALGMLALLYFYFQNYQVAQRAALKHLWTAATMSVAVLPFLVGFPVFLAVVGAGALAAKFDHRMPE